MSAALTAAIVTELTGPDGIALSQIEADPLAAGDVTIDVTACGLNFMDTLITRGKYQIKPDLPFSPSAECACVISAIGDGLGDAGLAIGDRVMAYTGFGAARGQVNVPAERIVKVPEGISLEMAAGLTVTYGTALYALRTRCGLGTWRGEARGLGQAPVLAVLGASGGAGTAAVEVGALLGCDVIACASSEARCASALERGARSAIGYGTDDLKTRLRDLTNGRGPDVIYDCIGGEYGEPALRALRPGGDYVVIGFAAGGLPDLKANTVLLKDCNVRGIHWGADVERNPTIHRDNMAVLVDAILTGA
ncbi:MAG: NADPH:quinone oxidoreductase family protein, partial [Pseudomonadota bacterium]